MRLALLATTFLLGLGLPASLPSASAATADDTATLFEGPLYSILLPEGWQHLSSKSGGRALVGDNYQKGTSNLGIIWVPDPDPVSDKTLTTSAIKRFLHILDSPSSTVTQSMEGQWHGRQVSEGVVLTQGSIKKSPSSSAPPSFIQTAAASSSFTSAKHRPTPPSRKASSAASPPRPNQRYTQESHSCRRVCFKNRERAAPPHPSLPQAASRWPPF